MERLRRLPIGAEIVPPEGVHFRVWAPRRRRVEVVLGSKRDRVVALKSESDGYFSGTVSIAGAGDLYWYRLDGTGDFPDPASRFQPEGPHGPSQVVDPTKFQWRDGEWSGVGLPGQVIYEMHIGTFTQEGTWESAIQQLPSLADIGITVLEVMPVSEFPGDFGWGYDGVAMFAPTRLYGQPDDFRRFVDEAHRLGMGVILDVVYNHLGPDGNYLREFSEHYFTSKYDNEWGDALNFDGDQSKPVREFFIGNAGYWIDEYHLDGLRLDATQQIFDESSPHVLVEVGKKVRSAAQGRKTILVTENECQHAQLVRPAEKDGYGLDGLWNDDFHHSARVALTGKNDAYYSDYLGQPQEFISAMKWGYLYQGQWYKWQKKRRGMASLDLEPPQFVNYLDNHDQVANSGRGERIHQLTSPGRYRAMTGLLLLGPGTPMLFQGQEFAASTPFFYFADHNPELAKLVKNGRGEFLRQFRDLALPEMQAQLTDPADRSTFLRSKLDPSEREKHAPLVKMHKDLLQLRREDPVFQMQRRRGVDGAVLSDSAFVLRYFADDGSDRLLIVNFGLNLHLNPAPEPLLAPPDGMQWHVAWSSDDVSYGGCGTPALDTDENWRIPGEATVALVPVPGEQRTC
jgi:maltooligosyltrehalose trehalohydrolase